MNTALLNKAYQFKVLEFLPRLVSKLFKMESLKRKASCELVNQNKIPRTSGSNAPVFLDITSEASNFSTKIMRGMWEMRDEQFLTDFKIKASHKELFCHKLVLAAGCEFFRCLLSHEDAKEVRQGFIEFPTLDFHALQLITEYFYCGQVTFELSKAQSLIQAADYLQVPDLPMKISKLVLDHLSADACLQWYCFADIYGFDDILVKAREMMCDNFFTITSSQDFFELDYTSVMEYLSWEEVDCTSSSALVALFGWMMHDVQERKHKVQDVLDIVKLHTCSQGALKHVMTQYGPHLITTPELQQQFLDAITNDTPEWTAAPQPGAGHDVIIVGGEDLQSGVVNRYTCMFNLKTGHVTSANRIPDKIPCQYSPAVCSSPTGAFFAGGLSDKSQGADNKDVSKDCVLYAKKQNAWTHLPDHASFKVAAGSVCVGSGEDTLFVVGEGSRMDYMNLSSKTWHSCPDMLKKVRNPLLASVRNCIYVIGSSGGGNGQAPRFIRSSLQCFDTSTSKWSLKLTAPACISSSASVLAVKQTLYIIGGNTRRCLSYNANEDTWRVLTPPHEMHAYGAAFHLKGRIFLCGGLNGVSASASIESYDPVQDKWNMLDVKLPKPLTNHCVIPQY